MMLHTIRIPHAYHPNPRAFEAMGLRARAEASR
jgi:hypothetical protein